MDNTCFNILGELKKPLSKEEQQQYLELAERGDNNAKEILFEHNLRLVAYIVNVYFNNINIDKDDLFQIGAIELWKAIQNYDSSKNTLLVTYASSLIYGAIKTYLREMNNIIKIPRSNLDLLTKIIRLENSNSNLTVQELSKILKVDELVIIDTLNSLKEILSLSSQISINNEVDEYLNLSDIIPDSKYSIDEIIEKKEIHNVLERVIDKLEEREKFVINYLFQMNINDINRNNNQHECAKILGVSQAQVSRIRKKALNKIRQSLINDEQTIDLLQLKNRKSYRKLSKPEF